MLARPYIISAALAATILLTGAAACVAQERIVRGSVTDARDAALPGATVRVFAGEEDTVALPFGAIADAEGTFEIRLPGRDTVFLAISFVGFKTARMAAAPGQDYLLIALDEDREISAAVEVIAVRRSRSVEDACCRVESIRDEVQQHAPFSPTAANALARYSSCTSTRVSCAVDNSGSVRLRGLEPTYAEMMIDGAPLFSGLSTFYGIGLIPAHALQTIRIVEGASSVLYGNGAVAGIVNLETRPPTEEPEFTLSAAPVGERPWAPDAVNVNAGYTGMAGDVGVAAFGSYAHHAMDDGTPTAGGYDRFSGLAKANVLAGNATELTLSVFGGHDSRRGRHRTAESGPIYNETVELSRYDISGRAAHSLADGSEINLGISSSFVDAEGLYGTARLDASQRTHFAEASYITTLGDHTVRTGMQLRTDGLDERSDLGIGYARTIISAFAQDEWALADLWTLQAGLRADRHSSAGVIVSPRGSLRFKPEGSLTMRLTAGSGFKGDALFNEDHLTLHGVYRLRANPDFSFERSFTLNYDVSYRLIIGNEGGLDANLNAYHTVITGKATPHPDSLNAGALFFVNSADPARLRGIEIQLRPTLGEHWSGSLAFQLIDYSRLLGGSYVAVPLAPRLNADASVMYHDRASGTTAEIWGSVIGSQTLPSNPSGLLESESYALVNLRAEKRFGALTVFAGVFNLLDARQTDTMPLAFAVGSGERVDGGIVWGSVEGREGFAGVRLTLGGPAQE